MIMNMTQNVNTFLKPFLKPGTACPVAGSIRALRGNLMGQDAETGTTYYYKVRAMAGSDPSAYTAEVAGKR